MRIVITKTIVAVILSFFICTAGYTATISPNLQDAIQAAAPNESLSVIIKLIENVDFKSFRVKNKNLARKHYRKNLLRALKKQNSLTATPVINLLKASKLKNITHLQLVNRISADIPANLIKLVANNPNVENIHLNTIYTLATPIPGAATISEWNLNTIGVKKLWSLGYRGQGIVVANMDTGVDLSHPELEAKWRGGSNSWFDAHGLYPVPSDPLGHGTQTMGVMVGGNVSGENIGVAPDAQWIAARIFNAQLQAPENLILNAFNWLMDPDGDDQTDDLPDVINASWGYAPNQCVAYIAGIINFEDIISRLKNEFGIAVVFSAGNSGPGLSTSTSPANLPSGYAVGATNELGYVASFSSRGPSLDCAIPENGSTLPPPVTSPLTPATPFPNVVAPGQMIKLADTSFGRGTALYTVQSGTSFAAPHVSGLMALLKNAMPSVTVVELESVLEQTAVDIDLPGFDDNTGWGLVNGVGSLFQLPVDTDGDLVFDGVDNCLLVANPLQIDSNNDGYGNRCDADLNGDNIVDFLDLSLFRSKFLSVDADADLNGDGFVDYLDLSIFRSLFLQAPGPSASNF